MAADIGRRVAGLLRLLLAGLLEVLKGRAPEPLPGLGLALFLRPPVLGETPWECEAGCAECERGVASFLIAAPTGCRSSAH